MKSLFGIVIFALSLNVFAQNNMQPERSRVIPGYVTNDAPLPGYISHGNEQGGAVMTQVVRPANAPYSYNGAYWVTTPVPYYRNINPNRFGY